MRTARAALYVLLASSCSAERAPVLAAVPRATVAPRAASTTEPAPPPTGSDVYEPRPDVVADDPALPSGTVRVTVLDADGAPIPRAPVAFETVIVRAPSAGLDVLGKDTAIADEDGTATFRKRRTDAVRHVASTQRGDGIFAVEPFTLGPRSGKKVVLHAYETVRDLEHALVGMQTATYLAIRADGIDVEVLHRIYNIGRVAWVPSNVRVGFPPGVTDFLASDLGLSVRVDEITAAGFTLVGTVSPGKHELTYRYRIPRDGRGSQSVHLDLPPRNAQVRVLLEAGRGARLEVASFPEAKQTTPGDGTPVLMTERTLSRGEAGLASLDVTIAGEPR